MAFRNSSIFAENYLHSCHFLKVFAGIHCLANPDRVGQVSAPGSVTHVRHAFREWPPKSLCLTLKLVKETHIEAVVAGCLWRGVIAGTTNCPLAGLSNTLLLALPLVCNKDIDTIVDAIDGPLREEFA